MKEKKPHPCPYYLEQTKSCGVMNNWWDGKPAECKYTREQLLNSKWQDDGYCSVFPGFFQRIDGTFIHPSELINNLGSAKGAEKWWKLLQEDSSKVSDPI